MKFSTLLRHLKGKAVNDGGDAVQRAPRRAVDVSICEIDGIVYPVENWSASGILLKGDERLFAKNESVAIKLRFRLSDKVIEIPHSATVARKSRGQIGLHFAPLPADAHSTFAAIIDDYNAQKTA